MARFIPLLVLALSVIWNSNDIYGQSIPYPDRHSTTLSDGWLSCEPAPNPNTSRGNTHWIMYDLGQKYKIKNFFIWNFNTPERTNSYDNAAWSKRDLPGTIEDGMNEIFIDISNDGKEWEELTHYFIPKASGTSIYTGEIVPYYYDVDAQYVMITGISNHGGKCYGLGEIRIEAEPITTNVKEVYTASKIRVYPNPARDKTKLYLKDFQPGEMVLKVVDLLGKQVDTKYLTLIGSADIVELQTADYTSGMYFIHVIQQNSMSSIKLEVIK